MRKVVNFVLLAFFCAALTLPTVAHAKRNPSPVLSQREYQKAQRKAMKQQAKLWHKQQKMNQKRMRQAEKEMRKRSKVVH